MAKSPALKESPSQTAGPYVHIGCTPNFVGISGVYPQDAGMEIWQADADGLYNSPSEPRGKADAEFSGWGRQPSDLDTGRFTFDTIRPGPVPAADGRVQAPHISFWIVARGINLGLSTRLYFDDESEANAADPVLSSISEPARRQTLLARREGDMFSFDIHLQGPDETVFFDV